MDKPLFTAIIIGLIIGTALGYIITIPKINEFETKTTILQIEKITLQSQITQLTKDSEEAKNLVNSQKTQLNKLNEEKASLQTQLTLYQQSDLYSLLEAKNTEITQLTQQINEKAVQITNLQSQLTSIEANNLELIKVSFSPINDTDGLIQHWIERANSTVDVAIFSFTRDSLADALISAKNRGVNVRAIMEKDNISDSGSEFFRLQSAGVSIIADKSGGLMHDKFFVIDGEIVGTGSYNWTSDAEDRNAENLLLIRSVSLATVYRDEFNYWWERYS